MKKTTSKNHLENWLTTAMFVALIATFSVGTWMVKGTTKDIRDANHLAELVSYIPNAPLHIARAITMALEGWADEHILMREQILAGRALFMYKVFNYAGRPKVVVGHRGWLYYVPHEEDKDKYKSGFYYPQVSPGPLTKNELYAWNKVLEERRTWLAKRGIKYLLVIAPDKESIYPENYPIANAEQKSMHFIDQLKEYLAKHSQVDFVDLRPALIAAKPYANIYYAHDSHWTKIGAFIAYSEIMSHLRKYFPNIKQLTLADYDLQHAYRERLDIANGIGLGETVTDNTVNLVYKNALPLRVRRIPLNLPGQSDTERRNSKITEAKGQRGLRVIMFADSFGLWLKPFLFRTFSRTTVQWCSLFPPELIKYEKPDIVIQEIVERNFKGASPFNPPELEER